MKKIIVNILFVFGVTTAASAQAYDPVPMAVTPANQPENNAFFRTAQTAYSNEVYKSYWVWDTRTVGWVKRVEVVVPAPIPVFTNDPRFQISIKGNDVCTTDACVQKTAKKPGG